MKIGIYGGAFNPPHSGHVDCAVSAAQQLALDLLLVIPSGTPPHKALPSDSPTAQDRFKMAQLAFRNVPSCEVTDIELRRQGESYTIDTVRELEQMYPGAQFYLIVGTDMYLSLTTWCESDALLRRITPAVALRTPGMEPETAAEAERLAGFGVSTEVVRNNTIEISSSQLREALSSRNWTYHLDYLVYSFIIERGLFGAKPDFDWLRLEAYKLLDEGRIRHVAGCEGEAVRLAIRWGADVDEAREGAILHDITKRLNHKEQLLLCKRYGIELDDFMRAVPKLLHGYTAAELSGERFNVSDTVKAAVKWHTTGHKDMTLLEKIIYLADYIEPNRRFDGVDELRAIAYQDIDKAMIRGLEMTCNDLLARDLKLDRHTLEALQDLKK